ncbi:MAG: hypothetical protein CI952_1629 [Methanohalophilus sp.]|nr:MAG: hypothetical protein A8273_1217 [Methanohalophilus sp. 2-GBenrich]RSD33209.1 MAG: hypothetical protein CI952_1629 [Methanohalophilus sp.]RXG35179.1 hypothetical protein CI957_203 [Methanohalophilus sp. WG1-DM]
MILYWELNGFDMKNEFRDIIGNWWEGARKCIDGQGRKSIWGGLLQASVLKGIGDCGMEYLCIYWVPES